MQASYSQAPTTRPATVLPYLADDVRRIDAALDRLWPNWRSRDRASRRFDHLEYEPKSAIKWLIKRRSLLTRTSNGIPAPLDQPVLVLRDGRDPRKCYAHPIIPDDEGKAWRLPVPALALMALGGPPYPGREVAL